MPLLSSLIFLIIGIIDILCSLDNKFVILSNFVESQKMNGGDPVTSLHKIIVRHTSSFVSWKLHSEINYPYSHFNRVPTDHSPAYYHSNDGDSRSSSRVSSRNSSYDFEDQRRNQRSRGSEDSDSRHKSSDQFHSNKYTSGSSGNSRGEDKSSSSTSLRR